MIAGLRWYCDADYEGYAEMYNDNPTISNFTQESIGSLYGEGGYLFLSAIFKTLGSQFFLLAFACCVASLLLKSMSVYKLSTHASLAMCLYLCLNFVTIEFIQMRWAVATALLSYGFCCQYFRKYKPAVLCFALSAAFSYFSILFWVVALVVTWKGYRRFYLLFLFSLILALFVKGGYLSQFLITDADLYALMRLTRYASDLLSHVGTLAYAKLVMYPVIYSLCVWWRPTYPWKTDTLNVFLLKLSLVLVSVTLLVSFIPMLHFRASVLADFFSIIWILNAVDKALEGYGKIVSYATLSALFATWFLIDLSNNIKFGYLYAYHTWL